MSSKVTENSNKESDEVKCKICHQYISKSKMFLHEGFCSRNNVFCQHCEKVFLKKDYEEHVKLIKKKITIKEVGSPSNSQKSKETQSETMKPNSSTEENDNMSNNMIPLVPKPSLEIVQMPITELYKINAPIFVSETGQIISDKNKNSSLLPFLGINFRSSKVSEKLLDDIIDQGDIFNENNSISENCYDFQGLTSLLNKNKTITNNNICINSRKMVRDSDLSIGLSSIQGNNNTINYLYKNNLINGLHSPLSKTIEINNNDAFFENNKENIPKNSIPKNPKFNTLYIDKSLANHSQKLLKKKYNFFTLQQTPIKTPENSTKANKSLKKSGKHNMPLDKESRKTPKRSDYNNLDNCIESNNYQSFKKEPKDSNSKRNSNKINIKFSKFSGTKKINQNYLSENKKSNEQFDSSLKETKKNKYIFHRFDTDNSFANFKKRKSNKIFDIPKPKRKEKKFEEFVLEDNDEICIDEIKRETLTRQFNPSSLNVVSLNCDKRNYPGFITNPDRYSQFYKDPKKLSLKKKLFQENLDEKNEKKNYPEDSVRGGLSKEKFKLFKRIYNISLDSNSLGNNEGIKISKCEISNRGVNTLKNGEIYNQLFFNNNKKILKYKKNKTAYKNTII